MSGIGLQVFQASPGSEPTKVESPEQKAKNWNHKEVARWCSKQLEDTQPIIIGTDHAFSFPAEYMKRFHISDWDRFLDDFQRHWPTDGDHIYVDFIRDGIHGNGLDRIGNARWRRLTEERSGAKSVFHFDVPGSVAKSSHAGIPWLRYIRRHAGKSVHFWPFDGWEIPVGKSVIVEMYPALWSRGFPREGRTSDQHDAYSVAEWLRRADLDGSLEEYFVPKLSPQERTVAGVEGWILGVM